MSRVLWITLAGCMLHTAVFSQQKSVLQKDSSRTADLEEVVVTASRMELKASQTGKVVTVIDQTTLRRNAGKTMAEILNQQAGIFINGANNPLGTNMDMYFRGAATGNVLILIDGVPVNDPSLINNSFDISFIQPAQVERVEILKGAQSTLWGSQAVAGVINIIMKKSGTGAFSPYAGLSYGSYGTFRGNAGAGGKAGKFSYHVDYSHTGSNGFSSAHDSTDKGTYEKDGFRQNALQLSAGYQIAPQLTVRYSGNISAYKTDIDAGAFADDRDFVAENKYSNHNIFADYTLRKGSLHFSQSFNHTTRVFTDDSLDIGGFSKWQYGSYKGNSSITELYGNYNASDHLRFVGGMQWTGQRTDQYYKSLSDYGPYETALGDTARISNLSLYASALLLNWHGFNMEGGLRYNHHSVYGSNSTFTLNPSFNLNTHSRVFVNISSGYRIPSLYQLYSEYGNKALQPEKSMNYEAGAEWKGDDHRNMIRLVAFSRNISDVIVFYTDPNTYESRYINRDRQHDKGFEIEGRMAVGKTGSWLNNFSYVKGSGEENGEKVNNLYRRPNTMFTSTLSFSPVKNLVLSPSFRFVGERLKGAYDAGPETMPSYYTIDLYAGYDLTPQFRLFTDFRNITNREYVDVVGFNSRRFNMMAGISWNLRAR